MRLYNGIIRDAMKKKRALVAEDNDEHYKAFKGFLAEMGLEVERESFGNAALERMLSRDYDIVILDLAGTPGCDFQSYRHRRRQGVRGRGGIPRQAEDQDAYGGTAGGQPLRRQPAEGVAGQVDVCRTGHHAAGRADPRYRRRRQV